MTDLLNQPKQTTIGNDMNEVKRVECNCRPDAYTAYQHRKSCPRYELNLVNRITELEQQLSGKSQHYCQCGGVNPLAEKVVELEQQLALEKSTVSNLLAEREALLIEILDLENTNTITLSDEATHKVNVKLKRQNRELCEVLKYARDSVSTLLLIAYGKDAKPEETICISKIDKALGQDVDKTKQPAVHITDADNEWNKKALGQGGE